MLVRIQLHVVALSNKHIEVFKECIVFALKKPKKVFCILLQVLLSLTDPVFRRSFRHKHRDNGTSKRHFLHLFNYEAGPTRPLGHLIFEPMLIIFKSPNTGLGHASHLEIDIYHYFCFALHAHVELKQHDFILII